MGVGLPCCGGKKKWSRLIPKNEANLGIKETIRYHDKRRFLEDYEMETDNGAPMVLGSGFNGMVKGCVNKESGQRCAVKSFTKLTGSQCDKEKQAHHKELLKNECRIYLALDHPNIARLLDVYEDEFSIFFVMEICSGGELYSRLISRKQYTEAHAQDALKQMLLALNYLHHAAIVHRDLKLENFLYWNEESDILKMIDFGFSTHSGTDSSLNSACGSLSYMAPEIIEAREWGAKVDMWSLGVITFMLLSGYPPFAGSSEDELIQKIRTCDYVMIDDRWKAVSKKGKDFVQRLLVVNPKERMSAQDALQHAWMEGVLVCTNATTQRNSEGVLLTDSSSASLLPRDSAAMAASPTGEHERKRSRGSSFRLGSKSSSNLLVKATGGSKTSSKKARPSRDRKSSKDNSSEELSSARRPDGGVIKGDQNSSPENSLNLSRNFDLKNDLSKSKKISMRTGDLVSLDDPAGGSRTTTGGVGPVQQSPKSESLLGSESLTMMDSNQASPVSCSAPTGALLLPVQEGAFESGDDNNKRSNSVRHKSASAYSDMSKVSSPASTRRCTSPNPAAAFSRDVLKGIQGFAAASHFKRAVLSMMAWGLSPQERMEVRELFYELDLNQDGFVRLDEFRDAIQLHYPHLQTAEIVRLFNALDTNHDEKIYYSDFLASMLEFRVSIKENLLKATFKRFDTDGTGYISVANMKEILGKALEGQRVEDIMLAVTGNKKGQISYAEFVKYLGLTLTENLGSHGNLKLSPSGNDLFMNDRSSATLQTNTSQVSIANSHNQMTIAQSTTSSTSQLQMHGNNNISQMTIAQSIGNFNNLAGGGPPGGQQQSQTKSSGGLTSAGPSHNSIAKSEQWSSPPMVQTDSREDVIHKDSKEEMKEDMNEECKGRHRAIRASTEIVGGLTISKNATSFVPNRGQEPLATGTLSNDSIRRTPSRRESLRPVEIQIAESKLDATELAIERLEFIAGEVFPETSKINPKMGDVITPQCPQSPSGSKKSLGILENRI